MTKSTNCSLNSKAQTASKLSDLCKEIVRELKVHTQIEEEIFYPAVRKQAGLEDLLRDAREEHELPFGFRWAV